MGGTAERGTISLVQSHESDCYSLWSWWKLKEAQSCCPGHGAEHRPKFKKKRFFFLWCNPWGEPRITSWREDKSQREPANSCLLLCFCFIRNQRQQRVTQSNCKWRVKFQRLQGAESTRSRSGQRPNSNFQSSSPHSLFLLCIHFTSFCAKAQITPTVHERQ